jgi:hypothetical protein
MTYHSPSLGRRATRQDRSYRATLTSSDSSFLIYRPFVARAVRRIRSVVAARFFGRLGSGTVTYRKGTVSGEELTPQVAPKTLPTSAT